MKKEENIYKLIKNKMKKRKVPIYKKCPNEGQPYFCPRTCLEIIGYKEEYNPIKLEI